MTKMAVDNTSGDEVSEKIIEKLEKMVELGKRAEDALRDIQAKGYAEGFFPVVEGETIKNWGHERRVGFNVEVHQLQMRVEPSRDRGPPLDDLIVLLDGWEDGPSGSAFKHCTMYLQGTMFRQTTKPGRKHILHQRKIPFGHLRFLKSGHSVELVVPEAQDDHKLCGSRGDVAQLYTNFSYASAKEAAKKVAGGMAVAIVRVEFGIPEDQLTCDMRVQVEKWLLEERHVERLCASIKEIAKVHEVMHS